MLKIFLSKAREKISFKNIKEFKFKKCTKLFSILVILIIVGLALPSGFAHATVIGDLIMGGVYVAIYIIFQVLFIVAYFVAWLGAEILNLSLNPAIMNQVFSNPGIALGWSLIRDICNLLFLLLLLLVAFGTIVQSQKYNIKNSLPKLLLAVFLINFSNVIAGAIIDFGNILMYGILGFMCPVANTCFQDMTKPLMDVINGFWAEYSWANAVYTGIGAQQALGIAISCIYTFMYGFILLAMAAFLLIRTAGLAILLILAPFAYFGEVMPGMEKIASKWWSNIWSYTLFGPLFALMLFISGQIASNATFITVTPQPELGTFGTLMSTIISAIIPLLFLLAVIPVTKELGLAGTDTILKNTTGLGSSILTGTAKYVGNAADRFAARGAKDTRTGFKGTLRRGLSNLSPTAWKRAAKNMTAEQDHDFDIAAGSHWNKLEKLPGGNKNINHQKIAVDREVTRVMSTLSDNIHELAETNKKAVENKNAILVEASLRKLANSGDTSVALKKNGFEESRYGFNDYMNKMKKDIGEERAQVLAEEVGYLEDKDGNSGFIGFRKTNEETGKTRLLDLRDEKLRDDNDKEISREDFEKLSEKDKALYKTDRQWQQKSVNAKLAGKTPYERNKRLKSLALLRGGELDDQGVEYYNEIGPKNLDQVENGIKKEMIKQRDALYKFAVKHKEDKWHTKENGLAESGLTDMEKAHLLKLEGAVGEGENRPTNVDREYPKSFTNDKKIKAKSNVQEEGVWDAFATSSTGKGRIGVDNITGEVEMDEIARENINKVVDLDEEAKKQAFEAYRQVMLHEDEHLKPKVKNLKNSKAREIMAEAGKLAGDNYEDMIDYIDKQALAHALADFAERGIEGMKNVKYGLGINELKPSDSHFMGIKPEVREEVINEMEKVRQNWVNKYEEKMKKDAEEKERNN